MRRIDLPDYNWADINEADDLSNRQSQELRIALGPALIMRERLAEAGVNAEVASSADDVVKAMAQIAEVDPTLLGIENQVAAAYVKAYLAAWSFGPLPTLDEINDLPGRIFNPLSVACVAQGQPEADTSLNPDPASPTLPSDSTSTVERADF